MTLLPRLALLASVALPFAPAHAAQDWTPSTNEVVEGPVVTFMRSNAGWTATVSLPEPATAIAFRLGEQGEWKETGLLDTVDPRTRRRMPNPSIPFDGRTPATTLYVRYAAASGALQGPYAIPFDPIDQLAREQKKILEMIAASWVQFRDFNGVLLYYTMLVSYRCAIQELRIGLDTDTPDKVIALPRCEPADPAAIPSNVTPYIRVPPNTHSASVQILYRDGTTSPVQRIMR